MQNQVVQKLIGYTDNFKDEDFHVSMAIGSVCSHANMLVFDK